VVLQAICFFESGISGHFGSSAAPVDHPKNSDFPEAMALHQQF